MLSPSFQITINVVTIHGLCFLVVTDKFILRFIADVILTINPEEIRQGERVLVPKDGLIF